MTPDFTTGMGGEIPTDVFPAVNRSGAIAPRKFDFVGAEGLAFRVSIVFIINGRVGGGSPAARSGFVGE